MSDFIFIANVSFDTTEEGLAKFFSACGTVLEATIPKDKATGRSKGVGFVKMSTEEETQKAMKALNGRMLNGRKIFTSKAKPQKNRPPGFEGKRPKKP